MDTADIEAVEEQRTGAASPWLKLLTAAVALGATGFAVRYAGQPLLEAHGFRQTQTAITAFWMIRDGWRLAYETPVAGYPWAIPFEFPLYQTLVALIAKLTGWPLDPIGRLVSFAFLLGCAWPAALIVKRLALPRQTAWVFCALLWSSPIYLFWGRTFMIETAALFFAFAAIPYGLDLLDPHPPWRAAVLCAVFGTIASLQKVTTGAPVLLVLGCLWLIQWIRRGGLRRPQLREIATVCCAFGVPLLVVAAWTKYTDIVKSANPFGIQQTSAAIRDWNFGTLQQRLQLSTYATVLWHRMIVPNAAGVVGLGLIAGALLVPSAARVRAIVASALAMFLVPILLFTNVHIVHDYYQSSCALFLIAALAVAVAAWVPSLLRHRAVVPVLTSLLVLANGHGFLRGYGPIARKVITAPRSRVLNIAGVLRQNTPPGSAFVAFGRGWSSEFAYYAERKAFMVSGEFKDYRHAWEDPAAFLDGTPLGALVVCPSKPGVGLDEARERAASDPRWTLIEASDCGILINKAIQGNAP
jgi:hypothetical protein